MSKKQRWVFIGLVLFPFALAMTFRTIDNYSFHQKIHQHKEEIAKEELPQNLVMNDGCYVYFMSLKLQNNIP